jgi:hypothetical protein
VLGGLLVRKARRDNGDKQDEWEVRFKEISKRVKAEKVVCTGKEPKP